MLVRAQISQSSALRQKRGQTATPRPDSVETEPPPGSNPSAPCSVPRDEVPADSRANTGQEERVSEKEEEPPMTNTDSEEQQEDTSASSDSLPPVLKFES